MVSYRARYEELRNLLEARGQFYLDAIQFACGDLEAPTAPR